MEKAELLQDLRQKTGSILNAHREFWKAPYLTSGVAKGVIAELLGNARTEWLLELLALHPEHYVFWCEQKSQANPTAFYQRGVALERIKFINTNEDLQQPLRLALESQHYPFVIAPNRFTDIKTYQRLSLLAEKSKSTLFLFADKKFSSAWPISVQLDINFSDDGFTLDVVKQKYGQSQ